MEQNEVKETFKNGKVGDGTPGPGRPKGIPNKSTSMVREAIANLLERNAPNMDRWLNQVAQEDPYKALDLMIKITDVIAPIFAAVKREVWNKVKFPSINWYSDNIICADMEKLGYRHFVSRAYVHHAGSQTVGTDFQRCHEEPRE